MKRTLLSVLTIAFFGIGANAQNVNIPDVNFKAYLVGNTSINTNLDTEIQVTEASAFTGVINCSSLSISDMTGIEAFTSLTDLNCYNNQLTNLDVSANTALTILWCQGNTLTNLDISTNTALTNMSCGNNQISNLDVSVNTALTNLYCYNNQLTSVNVSANTALTVLVCYGNQLTNLDISANTSLVDLQCAINQFSSLNASNGNNTNFTYFDATDNPDLTCIQVDDAAYSTTNWTDIDATASFSEDCNGGVGITEISDQEIVVYPNPASSELTINTDALTQEIKIFDLFGSLVQTETSSSFSIEDLSNGVYIMNVKTKEGIVRNCFIKE